MIPGVVASETGTAQTLIFLLRFIRLIFVNFANAVILTMFVSEISRILGG